MKGLITRHWFYHNDFTTLIEVSITAEQYLKISQDQSYAKIMRSTAIEAHSVAPESIIYLETAPLNIQHCTEYMIGTNRGYFLFVYLDPEVELEYIGEANIDPANIGEANIDPENIGEANIDAANIGEANIDPANIDAENIGEANIDPANIGEANIDPANIGEANIDPANIGEANIDPANIGEANIDPANIGEANIDPANIGEANIDPANIGEANIDPANIGEAMEIGEAIEIGEAVVADRQSSPLCNINDIIDDSLTMYLFDPEIIGNQKII